MKDYFVEVIKTTICQHEQAGDCYEAMTEDGPVVRNPDRGFCIIAEEKNGARWIHRHLFEDNDIGSAKAERLVKRIEDAKGKINAIHWGSYYSAYGSSAWAKEEEIEWELDQTDPDRHQNNYQASY